MRPRGNGWRAAVAVVVLGGLVSGCLGPYPGHPARHMLDDAEAARTEGVTTHRVSRGQTVYGLAQQYDTSQQAIIAANDLNPPYHLRVGETLRIPQTTSHTVAEGESLAGIAGRYGVAAGELAAANDIARDATLHPGDELHLPWHPDAAESTVANQAEGTASDTDSGGGSGQAGGDGGGEPAAREPGSFVMPVTGQVIAEFGPQADDQHNDGILIAAESGTPVTAADSGEVVYVGDDLASYGLLVLVRHDDDWVTAYAHLREARVERGDTVAQGDALGTVGSSGSADRPALHFEIRRGTEPVNPANHMAVPEV